ncbi:DUF998 domain-containing protein [Agromyces sp. NPDC049794]|uniref:DUF998 domain-containing protein n=1 Tax=unclassified Agromyces TaxID=2639701 RepID=UPI0033D23FD3
MIRHTVPSPARIRRAPALVAVLGASGFILFFALAHLVQPGIEPSWQPPSELALGASGWVMTTAFLVLGAACAGLALALASQVVTWPGRIGIVAVFAAAIGCLVAGVFPADPITTAPDAMTLAGTLHSIGPVLFDGIPIASVLLAVSLTRHSAAWRRVRPVLVIGATLSVGAAVLLTVSLATLMPETGQLGPDVPVGWQGRFLLLANALWVIAVGACALKIRRSVDPAASDRAASDATATSTSGRVS